MVLGKNLTNYTQLFQLPAILLTPNNAMQLVHIYVSRHHAAYLDDNKRIQPVTTGFVMHWP